SRSRTTANVVRADRYQAAAQAMRRRKPAIGAGQPILPITGALLAPDTAPSYRHRKLRPLYPKGSTPLRALTRVENEGYCPADFPMVPLVPFRVGRPATRSPRSY